MRQIVPNYIFAPGPAGQGTITLPEFTNLDLGHLVLITDPVDNRILFNMTDPARGASVSGNVITLDVSTVGLSPTDDLSITYDVGLNDPDYQDPTIINTELATLRDDFDIDSGGGFNAAKWIKETAGTAGASAAISAGAMVINAGTANTSKIGFISLGKYRLPFRMFIIHKLSQRIAGNSFVIQITNAAGDTVAAWVYDGTVVTNAKVRSTKKGNAAIADTAVTINTSAANDMLIIDARVDGIEFSDKLPDSNAGDAARAVRNTTNLINTEDYFVEFYSLNTAAPATNTVWTIQKIVLQQLSRTQVEVTAGRGNGVSGRGVPVIAASTLAVAGAVTVSGTASTTAVASAVRMGMTAASGLWWDDTVTNLGASATFTGTARDCAATTTGAAETATSYLEEFAVESYSDVAGTLYLEVSRDGTTWYRIKKVVAAQTDATSRFYAEIIHDPKTRYCRAVYVNGAAATTVFAVQSSQMAA